MNEEELYCRLLSDLKTLKLPVEEVDIVIRPFSKTYYGRYFPIAEDGNKPRIFIYPYEEDNSFMVYDLILKYLVHEMCHHLQYSDVNFERYVGVMHDTNFWKLFNHYMNRAIEKRLVNEEEIA